MTKKTNKPERAQANPPAVIFICNREGRLLYWQDADGGNPPRRPLPLEQRFASAHGRRVRTALGRIRSGAKGQVSFKAAPAKPAKAPEWRFELRAFGAPESALFLGLGYGTGTDPEPSLGTAGRYLRAFLQATPEAAFLANPRGVILEYNAAAERLFGYPRRELVGQRLEDTILPGAPEANRRRRRTAPPLREQQVRCSARNRDGEEFRAELRLSRLPIGRQALFLGFVRDLTAEEQAWQLLNDEQALLDSLVEAIPGTFFVFDENGRMVRWNPRLESVSGYSGEEIGAMQALDFIPPEQREFISAKMRECFEQGEADAEGNLLTRDGQRLNYFYAGRRVNVEGQHYIVGVGYDISSIRAAQQELRASEERFRLVTRVTSDVIWDWNIETDETWHNEGLQQTFGYTDSKQVTAWMEHIHPADRRRVEDGIREHVRSGEGFWEARYRLRRGDGGYAHVYDRGLVLRDASGKPLRMVGAMVDITRETLAEEKLKLNASAMEAAAEGMLILDADLHILAFNPAYLAILGHKPENVLGKQWRFMTDPHVGDTRRHMILEAVHTIGHWRGELDAGRPDGQVRPVLLGLSTVRDAEGAICNYIAVISDLSLLRHYQQQAAFLTGHHPLTGLPTMPVLQERLAASLHTAGQSRNSVALLEVDLDGFKLVNDALGRTTGDDLLRQFSRRLLQVPGAKDAVFHTGSDSFVVLLEAQAVVVEATGFAERLLKLLEQPFTSGNNEAYLSACIGVAVFPDHGGEGEALLKHADVALNRAKLRGPNAWELYAPQMSEAAAELMLLGSRLRHAIERGEFTLNYQPFVDMRSGRIVGVEALLRWQQPELGLIPPARFIPVAEQTGLITPLGEWVLGEACRQMRRWHEQGLSELQLAVNISARQLRQPDFVARVRRALQETGLPPQALVLEITESVMVENPERVQAFFAELHRLGVEIAVDDFGTGYSSLSYIRDYRVDYIKIDRSFVSDLAVTHPESSLARAIVAMAKTLGVRVIAEGVETETQQEFLRQLECEQGQGYLYAYPQPAAEVEVLLHGGLLPSGAPAINGG